MKLALTIGWLAAVLAAGAARGAIIDITETDNLAIPDGNPVGIDPTGVVSSGAGGDDIVSLVLDLNVSGGYNGDLTAYLEAPSGVTVSLLERPGVTEENPFGYGGSGLNVEFSDAASASLQSTAETFGQVVTGNYQANGPLATFDGQSANGTWRLFIADDEVGGGQAVLNSWSLDMEVIPEAAPGWGIALVLGAALGLEAARRRRRARGGV